MQALEKAPPKLIDVTKPQKVTYCVPTWLRDEQIKLAIDRVKGRIKPIADKRTEPIAIVCFGPSLNETWEQVRGYKHIMTCSGAHKFLVDRGIIPTHHIEVDPRPHKVTLMGAPQKGTEYLIASACHPKVFDHLEGFDVKLWHIFDTAEEGARILPPGEWAFMGGSSVGLRCFTIASALGFREFHIFGMDGCAGPSGSHSASHPNPPAGYQPCEYNGKMFQTTVSMAECARQTFTEIDNLPGIKAKFYGDGLVQEMAKNWAPKAWEPGKQVVIGFNKPELISEEYRELNRKIHQSEPSYGIYSSKHAELVLRISAAIKAVSILDYGAGKGRLAEAIPFPIWEYDPAVPGKDKSPRPADLVACLDVLEHIEPDKLKFVLDDLKRCVKQVGLFIIHSGAAQKSYANGKNTHLIQESLEWWQRRLERFFTVTSAKETLISKPPKSWDGKNHYEYQFIVGPKSGPVTPERRWDVLEELISENGWTKGAEIGVKEGKTFLHLLKHCPRLSLVGVDLFEARPGLEAEGGESHADADLPGHYERLKKIVADCYSTRASLAKGLSTKAAQFVPDGSLDFAFIDADHREAAVMADIKAWRPKIRPGGMLCGHDAQEKFPGVITAIDKLCPGWTLYPDSVWGFQC